jgi:PIN domain nuclease of toxin-antitoxin system
MVDILLDSIFLLPTFGVEVEDIGADDLKALKDSSKKVGLYCSYVSFVEVIGKLARNSTEANFEAINLAIRSLLESGTYGWVYPSAKATALAFELRAKGHRDNIDNILYSTALDAGMRFLSMDEELKDFLSRKGYNTRIMIGVKQLKSEAR